MLKHLSIHRASLKKMLKCLFSQKVSDYKSSQFLVANSCTTEGT